jgi:hypothetical protein
LLKEDLAPLGKRRFHPIDFTVSVSGMSVWTKRNELVGESRTRSF